MAGLYNCGVPLDGELTHPPAIICSAPFPGNPLLPLCLLLPRVIVLLSKVAHIMRDSAENEEACPGEAMYRLCVHVCIHRQVCNRCGTVCNLP